MQIDRPKIMLLTVTFTSIRQWHYATENLALLLVYLYIRLKK